MCAAHSVEIFFNRATISKYKPNNDKRKEKGSQFKKKTQMNTDSVYFYFIHDEVWGIIPLGEGSPHWTI